MKLLHLCHNDPVLHPGGTEIFAQALYREMRRRDGIEAYFLAATDNIHRRRRPGTLFQIVTVANRHHPDDGAGLMWTGHFDRFHLSQPDATGVFVELAELLALERPGLVHVHHLLGIGVEALFLVRRVLPDCQIVVTLHDYFPICAQDGTMVTLPDRRLCDGWSPDACSKCLPKATPVAFRLRESNIKRHFGLVDRFIAPSRFLHDRYLAWGLAPDRIMVLPNGHDLPDPVPARPPAEDGRRNVFAVFGNISPLKGTLVAVEAARLLLDQGVKDFRLVLHGAPQFQSESFKDELARAVAALPGRVSLCGAYRRDEIPRLIAGVDWVIVPSVWWENQPLVIDEAFHHRRPVICSDIGGMAERVRDGTDGLHFPVGDPAGLAAVMRRAIEQPSLWEQLRANIRPVRSIAAAADDHLRLYRARMNEMRGFDT